MRDRYVVRDRDNKMETKRDALTKSRRQRDGDNVVVTTRSRHGESNTAIDTVAWTQREVDAGRTGDREMEGSSRRQGDGNIHIHKDGCPQVVTDGWRQRYEDRGRATYMEKERCIRREMPVQRCKRPQREKVRPIHGGIDIYGRLIPKRLAQHVRGSWSIYSVADRHRDSDAHRD